MLKLISNEEKLKLSYLFYPVYLNLINRTIMKYTWSLQRFYEYVIDKDTIMMYDKDNETVCFCNTSIESTGIKVFAATIMVSLKKEGTKEQLVEYLEYIETVANKLGCDVIEAQGRHGWKRVSKGMGYESSCAQFYKDLRV
jgi:hypothetical protein